MSHLLDNMSSYDGNVLLAAIVSLLLVILFVLLLHIYAKWFLAQPPPRRRRSRSSSMSVSHVLLPAPRFHHFHSFTTTIDTNNSTNISLHPRSKGLEASLIASIPLFVYTSAPTTSSRSDDDDVYTMNTQDGGGGEGFGLECVICLSGFEESGVGRCLPKCSHVFHVECIDMWLHYHSNCPVCRAPVVGGEIVADDSVMENNNNDHNHNHNHSHSHEIEEATAAGNVELVLNVIVEGETRLTERVVSSSSTPDHVTSNCDNLLQVVGSITAGNHSASAVVAAAASTSSLRCSLNRMSSRQGSEHKVFPSSTREVNVNQLDA